MGRTLTTCTCTQNHIWYIEGKLWVVNILKFWRTVFRCKRGTNHWINRIIIIESINQSINQSHLQLSNLARRERIQYDTVYLYCTRIVPLQENQQKLESLRARVQVPNCNCKWLISVGERSVVYRYCQKRVLGLPITWCYLSVIAWLALANRENNFLPKVFYLSPPLSLCIIPVQYVRYI